MRRRVLRMLILFAIVSYFWPSEARAYLDPGTGSYVLQLVLAALLGVAFATKMFWLRIKTFLAGLLSKKPKEK
ncbi:MAG: hypothetical protein OEN01_07520 [Candidatus Krumholzibacteria bacterium]|nr:hypothetical protein [Candidatus Krumholzibacteria bacterium]